MLTNFVQNLAEGNISFHSLPGDQDKWGPFPVPFMPSPVRPLPVELSAPTQSAAPALELLRRAPIAG